MDIRDVSKAHEWEERREMDGGKPGNGVEGGKKSIGEKTWRGRCHVKASRVG